MYPPYLLMKTLQDERLRATARGQLAAEARRARPAGCDHAAATRAGLGILLGVILLFAQGIIPAGNGQPAP